MLKLYNSKTRKKEKFTPISDPVRMYTCGPTVYDYAHIGNLRTYIFEDFLKRTLLYNGYKVKHVMNITDVGHLISDDDKGEDKVEKKAKEEEKDAWKLVDFYIKQFKKDIFDLNIKQPNIFVRATDTIKEQIKLIKKLEQKGYTYKIKDGIYFNTAKLSDYGKMANLEKREAGKRVEMKEKKNPTDFALWKFSRPDENRQMEWGSPWGIGFPGWHTECVVMSQKHLGVPFDIHCGGIDHIEIHHPNEIAQSKAVYGKNPANFWIHGEFLTVKEEKMSKSKGNFYTLADIKRDFSPLSYRYLCLNSHYQSKMNFSKNAMVGAQNSLTKLKEKVNSLTGTGKILKDYKKKFKTQLNNNLNTPNALKIVWGLLKDNKVPNGDKKATIIDFDNVLGLNLTQKEIIPENIKKLAQKRKDLRKQKKYKKADKIRKKINNHGYKIKDSKDEYKIIKK